MCDGSCAPIPLWPSPNAGSCSPSPIDVHGQESRSAISEPSLKPAADRPCNPITGDGRVSKVQNPSFRTRLSALHPCQGRKPFIHGFTTHFQRSVPGWSTVKSDLSVKRYGWCMVRRKRLCGKDLHFWDFYFWVGFRHGHQCIHLSLIYQRLSVGAGRPTPTRRIGRLLQPLIPRRLLLSNRWAHSGYPYRLDCAANPGL